MKIFFIGYICEYVFRVYRNCILERDNILEKWFPFLSSLSTYFSISVYLILFISYTMSTFQFRESPQRSGNINRITFFILFNLFPPKGSWRQQDRKYESIRMDYRGWLSQNSWAVEIQYTGFSTLGNTHQMSSGHSANCENVLLPS